MELVTIIQNGGPYALAAVLAFLYWQERTDRKETQKLLSDLQSEFVERLINAINAASQATRDITTAVTSLNATFQTVMYRLRDRADDGER